MWTALGTFVFGDFNSEATILLKRKRAGEGDLPRRDMATFLPRPGSFTMEQNKKLAGCLGVLWRYLVSLLSWVLSGIYGWVSGLLWPANWSQIWVSQCATRGAVGGHSQPLHRDHGRS